MLTEEELYDCLFERLCDAKDAHYEAFAKMVSDGISGECSLRTLPLIYQPEGYAEVAKEIPDRTYEGKLYPGVKVGTQVRITMVSRMGDMGFTEHLDEKVGYRWRTCPGDGFLTNCRLER